MHIIILCNLTSLSNAYNYQYISIVVNSKNLREDGTTVVQISVGNQTDLNEAKKYVSLPESDHYLQVDTYQELSAVQINLLKIICTRVLKVYQEGIFDLICNEFINFIRLTTSFAVMLKLLSAFILKNFYKNFVIKHTYLKHNLKQV